MREVEASSLNKGDHFLWMGDLYEVMSNELLPGPNMEVRRLGHTEPDGCIRHLSASAMSNEKFNPYCGVIPVTVKTIAVAR